MKYPFTSLDFFTEFETAMTDKLIIAVADLPNVFRSGQVYSDSA